MSLVLCILMASFLGVITSQAAGYLYENYYIIEEDMDRAVIDDSIDMSAAGYQFHEEAMSLVIPTVSKTYKIAWVSDLHLNADQTWGDGVSEANWDSGANVNGRKLSMGWVQTGYYNYQLIYPMVNYLNNSGFDAVVFGGDLYDYVSNENFKYLNYLLSNLTIPWVYIRSGDHDYNTEWSSGSVSASKLQSNLPDGGSPSSPIILSNNGNTEVVIIGMNKSTDGVLSSDITEVEKYNSASIPIILATHVAYESRSTITGKATILEGSTIDATLYDAVRENHNEQTYYWATQDPYNWSLKSNITMYNFLCSNVYSTDTSVKAVLAGHVHTVSWDGYLTDYNSVREHIFLPAYAGYVGIVTITSN